ncbi:spermidine synthase [Candidatus Magnetoovum chiemensis]|nr:spermidine synthase [Candidatus Magnetoovum chiemensis]
MIRFFEKEPFAPITHTYEVERVLYHKKSKYQDIMIIENPYFGKMLILDGIVQTTERDEFFYHEMLTHVAMYAHPNPKRIIVIGGGDGGIVREALKHDTVEKIYFIEIDEEVINVSREFLPSIACAIDDKKVEIKPMDGALFISKVSDIDIVIVDSTDIIGFARSLFTNTFFNSVKNALSNDGILVTHTESLHHHQDIVIEMQKALKEVFPIVDLYTSVIPTYPGNWWTYAVGSKELSPRVCRRPFNITTKYYDQEVHSQAFLTSGLYTKLLNNQLKW